METMTALPSETTTRAATIPPILTATPGIGETLTALYSTPGAQETLVAQQTVAAATEGGQMQALADLWLPQCPNPTDPPSKPGWKFR